MVLLLGEMYEQGMHWLRPGTTHHTRQMSQILYPAKVFLFSDQVGCRKNVFDKLESLLNHNALLYNVREKVTELIFWFFW